MSEHQLAAQQPSTQASILFGPAIASFLVVHLPLAQNAFCCAADGMTHRICGLMLQDTMAGYAALLHTLDSAEPGRHSKQAQSELQAGVVMQRRLIAHARGWQPLLLYKNNMQLLQHNKQFSWEEVVQAHRQMLVSQQCTPL